MQTTVTMDRLPLVPLDANVSVFPDHLLRVVAASHKLISSF